MLKIVSLAIYIFLSHACFTFTNVDSRRINSIHNANDSTNGETRTSHSCYSDKGVNSCLDQEDGYGENINGCIGNEEKRIGNKYSNGEEGVKFDDDGDGSGSDSDDEFDEEEDRIDSDRDKDEDFENYAVDKMTKKDEENDEKEGRSQKPNPIFQDPCDDMHEDCEDWADEGEVSFSPTYSRTYQN